MATLTIKIIVGMDGDGHFVAAPLSDRLEVLKALNTIDDGEYFTDVMENEYPNIPKEKLLELGETEWEHFIISITQRGTVELINIKK